MMYTVETRCTATLTEIWRIEVPDELTDPDEVDAYINEAFGPLADGPETEFVSEESSDERDREVISFEPEDD